MLRSYASLALSGLLVACGFAGGSSPSDEDCAECQAKSNGSGARVSEAAAHCSDPTQPVASDAPANLTKLTVGRWVACNRSTLGSNDAALSSLGIELRANGTWRRLVYNIIGDVDLGYGVTEGTWTVTSSTSSNLTLALERANADTDVIEVSFEGTGTRMRTFEPSLNRTNTFVPIP